jgi:5-methylcytosine-specific restriction endonuclease McrA
MASVTNLSYYRDYRAKNRGRIQSKYRAWVAKNPGRKRASRIRAQHKRRALLHGSFSRAEWEYIKYYYGYTCPGCLRSEPEVKLTVDHIVPLCRGGLNSRENLQPLCMECNARKSRTIRLYPPVFLVVLL